MCGACAVAAPSHWSAPFLASVPARATAARAVGAMIRSGPAVVGVPGGFLVRRPTGAAVVVPHLGSVWQTFDRLGVPRPVTAEPPLDVGGPMTLPPVRAGILDVHLALSDAREQGCSDEELLDGRGTDPHVLVGKLRARAASSGSRAVTLLLGSSDLAQVLPGLAAHPSSPFQLRLPAAPADRARALPVYGTERKPDAAVVPALLAWVAGHEGQGRLDHLVSTLPAAPDRVFRMEMLNGLVTCCTVERPATEGGT